MDRYRYPKLDNPDEAWIKPDEALIKPDEALVDPEQECCPVQPWE